MLFPFLVCDPFRIWRHTQATCRRTGAACDGADSLIRR